MSKGPWPAPPLPLGPPPPPAGLPLLQLLTPPSRGGGGPAGSAPRAVHAENAAVAPKLVVGAAVGHAAEAKQAQRARAHDAGFAGHIQVTAAGGRWSRWWSARVALAAQASRGGSAAVGCSEEGGSPRPGEAVHAPVEGRSRGPTASLPAPQGRRSWQAARAGRPGQRQQQGRRQRRRRQ